MTEVATALVATLVGILIGASGVGGVLLISFLVLFTGLGIHQAAATSLFSFLFPGLLGSWLFHRKGSIEWRIAIPVCAGAVPASYLGTFVASMTSARVLTIVVGLIIVVAGVNALLPRHGVRPRSNHVDRGTGLMLLGVGAASGFGSGVSGAGGPVFSVPIMVALRYSALAAVGTSQVLQVVAAVAGSVGNLQRGLIDWRLAAVVAAFQLLGVTVGVRLAHSLPDRWLKALAGLLCLVAGGLLVARAV
ncbi:MAG: sulfite exporter TauE/SafE family protein [Burkholderiaceae bacterium]